MNAATVVREVPDGAVSFGRRLTMLAHAHPDAAAVVFAPRAGDERTITWSELEATANQTAHLLAARGVGPGSTVVVGLPNAPEHLAATFGSWKLGASVLPLRWDLPVWERRRLLAIAEPALTIASWDPPEPAALTPEDLAHAGSFPPTPPVPDAVPPYTRLIATSGSTGTPKIVVAPSPGWFVPGEFLPVLGDTSGQTVLAASPLYHVNGFSFGAYTPLMQDSTIVLMERFDAARVVDLMEKHHVAFAVMVPTMLQRIARLDGVRDRDFSSIERIVYGGASIPDWVVDAWLELVPPERFSFSYGGTEAHGTTTATGTEWLAHRGTCGRPINGEVRIVGPDGRALGSGEVGEVQLRSSSPAAPFRYIGVPTPTPDPEGWGSFGDLGYLDDDGYLYIVDRRHDLIVSGGANVYPAEVEAALSEHPSVADVVVVGLPDREWGHRVHAIVQATDSRLPPNSDALAAHCRTRLAPYKVPKTFEFVERVPRSDAGKVNRSALVSASVSRATLSTRGGDA